MNRLCASFRYFFIKIVEKVIKRSFLLQASNLTLESQVSFLPGVLEEGENLTYPETTGRLLQKEVCFALYPLGSIQRQPTSCDDTVEMGIIHEGLGPRMQNLNGPYLCFQVLGVLC